MSFVLDIHSQNAYLPKVGTMGTNSTRGKKMNPGIFPRNSRINNANANDMHIYCKLQHSICLFGIFLGFFYVRLGTGRTHIGGFGTHRLGIGVIQKHVALGIGDTGLRIGETGIWDWGNLS